MFLVIKLQCLSCMLQEVLRDRTKVQQMVELFDPVVRAMDGFAGERVSMRVSEKTEFQNQFTVVISVTRCYLSFKPLGRLIWNARMDGAPLRYLVINSYLCESP